MVNAISTLVDGEGLQGDGRWQATMAGTDGSIYGIPCSARKVIKFNPVDKSITHIGPDLGDEEKWWTGAMSGNGIIYCVPWTLNRRCILKIDTNTDTVTELDVEFPEQLQFAWISGALALDGCIYYMPSRARRILKLDPSDDSLCSVGDDLGDESYKYLYSVAVVSISNSGCIYGLPNSSKRIVKYDPINDITSYVGDETNGKYKCSGGTVGRDGNIYALTKAGFILKIDTTHDTYKFVGDGIVVGESNGWGDAITGNDGCIYWPPCNATHILKYDIDTNQTSFVGDDFGSDQRKWSTGVLAPDGVIYCLPYESTRRILLIDPFRDFRAAITANMEEHPEELGFLFDIHKDAAMTHFKAAIIKFGFKQTLKVLEGCMPPPNEICTVSNLYPFMTASSQKECPLSIIYVLLRQCPNFVNFCIV